jgi:NitT/TauT family transport system substrate-binding protein
MRHDPAGNPLLNRRRRPVQPRLMLAAASGLAVLLAAGCSGGGGAGSPVSGTITIAAVPGVDDAPIYLAQTKGIFAADGLHVQFDNVTSDSAALADLEAGRAQIAASDYGSIFSVEESGTQGSLRILADGYDAGEGDAEILVPAHSKIVNPTELAATTIGLPEDSTFNPPAPGVQGVPGNLLGAAATAVISNYLISGANLLTWQMLPQAQEVTDLGNGTLKAALLTEPYIYEAESQFGASALVDACSDQTANLPLSGYVATSAWVKGNAAAVADFQAALSQAQAQATMTGPVQQEMPKMPGAGIDAQTADMVSIGTYPTQTSASRLQADVELLFDEGVLTNKNGVDVTQMLVKSGG